MKSNFKKSKGFTLIELIIVIIILGLLAVTVAPKFIDLSGDARGAVMEGVAASIESANTLVHAKALVAGQAGASGSVEVEGEGIDLIFGYPNITDLADVLDFDVSASSTVVTFVPADGTFTHVSAVDDETCRITVQNATSAAKPSVRLVKTGC